MKTTLVLLAILLSFGYAKADGFICHNESGDLKISVFNKTQAENGTRSPGAMILSNPQLSRGDRTIAVFHASDKTLLTDNGTSPHLLYIGNIDGQINIYNRPNASLLGTKVGGVSTVYLTIDFTYGDNLKNGETTPAVIALLMRNGDSTSEPMICSRYLKGK